MSRGYTITDRAPEHGGGYNVTFLNEDGTEGGGGAFPAVIEAEDDYDAYEEAMQAAADWVGYSDDLDEETRQKVDGWETANPWAAADMRVQALFGSALEEIEATRSKAFHKGAWEALTHRCGYEPAPECPYAPRTPEADAWAAGCAEGYNLWRECRHGSRKD